jgi:hypothetical protein
MKMHFAGMIAGSIKRLINGGVAQDGFEGAIADEHQQNALWGIHQLLVRLPDDPTLYRVLIAPADAPIKIASGTADQHFAYPIGKMPR